ncbi:MAG: hypothetical protein OEY44_01125, partial [Candidatus Peregrinibacteria bacterium]|nr:hypothetical protein [Candidatus Peregrinibacteria bacterium]
WDNQNYQQRVKDFEKQTQSSIAPSIRTSPSARQRLEQLGSELKENFVLVNTLVPYNIIRLIEARDYEFEKGDGRVKKLLKEKANLERLANLSWEDAYNEMVHNNNYRVSVTTESGVPDAYRLNFAGEELWVHKSGFIITRNSQGKYEPLAEYGTHLTEQYFDQNPNAATELLQDAQGPGVQQKIDVAKEKKEKLDHQALIDQMEPALGDADWDTLKAVAKSIQDPNNLAALESQLETMEKKVQDSPDDKKKEVLEAHEELLLNAIIKPIKGDHEIAKKAFAVKELKPYLENLKRINRLDKEMSGMSWTELKELAVHLAYPENKVAIKEHYDKIEGGFKGDTDAEQQAKTELIDAWTKAMHKDPKLIDAGEQKLNLPPI